VTQNQRQPVAQVEGTQSRGVMVWCPASRQFEFVLQGDDWRMAFSSPDLQSCLARAQAAVHTIDPAADWRLLGIWACWFEHHLAGGVATAQAA
jgi:hypothetical protein